MASDTARDQGRPRRRTDRRRDTVFDTGGGSRNPHERRDDVGEDKRVMVPYRGGLLEAPSADLAAEAMADIERRRRKHELSRERWGADNGEQMARLAISFPTLAGAPGTDPWDVEAFLRWACGPGPSSGAMHAASFRALGLERGGGLGGGGGRRGDRGGRVPHAVPSRECLVDVGRGAPRHRALVA